MNAPSLHLVSVAILHVAVISSSSSSCSPHLLVCLTCIAKPAEKSHRGMEVPIMQNWVCDGAFRVKADGRHLIRVQNVW